MKARALGKRIGRLQVGDKNCITDVPDVRVGHVTLDEPLDDGQYACTGVTAILPHGNNLFQEKVVGASVVLNGFGKTTGLVQVNELGLIEAPILLTNTFSVPAVTEGVLRYMLTENEDIGNSTGTINVVVGECNDSYLNSIRYFSVRPSHAIEAIQKASTETASEGPVGAGKGMICFGYKGGIGSSSRLVRQNDLTWTVGCLVVSNFGKVEECAYPLEPTITDALQQQADGSIMIVLATNAPLSSRQLQRVAKRCGIGLGRTGSHWSHGSGDIVIAFTTAHRLHHEYEQELYERSHIRDDAAVMNDLFTAAAEATEEAILNSLTQATSTAGRLGRVVHPLPLSFS